MVKNEKYNNGVKDEKVQMGNKEKMQNKEKLETRRSRKKVLIGVFLQYSRNKCPAAKHEYFLGFKQSLFCVTSCGAESV